MNDLTHAIPTTAKPVIGETERARRQDAIDYGRDTVRLEGFVLDDFAEELNQRYVAGEITRADHLAALKAHYG